MSLKWNSEFNKSCAFKDFKHILVVKQAPNENLFSWQVTSCSRDSNHCALQTAAGVCCCHRVLSEGGGVDGSANTLSDTLLPVLYQQAVSPLHLQKCHWYWICCYTSWIWEAQLNHLYCVATKCYHCSPIKRFVLLVKHSLTNIIIIIAWIYIAPFVRPKAALQRRTGAKQT